MQALFILLAILPPALIIFLSYRADKYDKEPIKFLLISFGLGILCALPAYKAQELGYSNGINESGGLGMLLLHAFVLVAFVEELMKFACLVLLIYPRKVFNEPLDGIIYAVMISMGFAAVENVMYALMFGFETTIIRAFTAVPAHAVFAIIMGFFVGKAKFQNEKPKRNQLLALGLAIPFLIHGFYDFFIIQEYYDWLTIFSAVVLLASSYVGYKLFKEHQENSPFKPGNEQTSPELETETIPTEPRAPLADDASDNNEISDAIFDSLEKDDDEE